MAAAVVRRKVTRHIEDTEQSFTPDSSVEPLVQAGVSRRFNDAIGLGASVAVAMGDWDTFRAVVGPRLYFGS